MSTATDQSSAHLLELQAERVRVVIRELLCWSDAPKLKDTDNFETDLDADSLDLLEIVMGLEDEFQIQISDDDAAGVKTVADAIDLVARYVARR